MLSTTLALIMCCLSVSVWAEQKSKAVSAEDFNTSRKFVETSYGRIAYVERGEGPVALFVHAALMNGYQWRYQLQELSDVRRCIALDTLGMGYTEPAADSAFNLKTQAGMIKEFLDALGIDKVDIIGNDSGGGATQVFAANNPKMVRSMTLTNCEVHDFDIDNPSITRLRAMASGGMMGKTIKSIATNPGTARVIFGNTMEHPENVSPETARTYFEPLAASEERMAMIGEFMLSTTSEDLLEAENALKNLDAPVLIIWGMKDMFFEGKWAHWLRDNLKNVHEVVELETGLLFFPEEYPDLMNEHLRALWATE